MAVVFASMASHPAVACAQAQKAYVEVPNPLLSWHFDTSAGERAIETVHHADGVLSGNYLHVQGFDNRAVRLDGETGGVTVKAAALPELGPALTLEAWIAIDAYPWGWAPIVDQREDHSQHEGAGFLFGVDASGHLGVDAYLGGQWQRLASKDALPLHKWTHVVATIGAHLPAEPASNPGIALYINGRQIAATAAPGTLKPARATDLLLGRNREPALPDHYIHPKFPVLFGFDGILNEVNLYATALTPGQVQAAYSRETPPAQDPLMFHNLPSGTAADGPFGAVYTTLKYDPLWDAPRRVAPDSDVVVRFDDAPVRLVAWQGANYIPAWVTENGKWYTDEFVETWGADACPGGEDCEPMSDKQNRDAHVRIVESTPARVVLHVHYGQCEVEHDTCAHPDPITGFTDSADDTYTIYPDAVAARKSVAWSSKFSTDPAYVPEFQETIIINAPGTRPEDNIANDALILLNMRGQAHTYTWPHPPRLDQPLDANIQVVGLKSQWRPFQIVMPDHPQISIYQGEPSASIFEWWNHWPVAQVRSSGISAVTFDRPSHSSLSHIEGAVWQRGPSSVTKIMLDGLTDEHADKLPALARSWAHAPQAALKAGGAGQIVYDPAQRAYLLQAAEQIDVAIHASKDAPLVNPAFVIDNWKGAAPVLWVNGVSKPWGADARYGIVPQLEGARLVLWLHLEAESETELKLTAPAP